MAHIFDDIERHGDRIAVIDETGAMSFRALAAAADAVGARLCGRPLVVVVCRNDLDCLVGYVGIMRAGAVALLIHHTATSDQVAAICAGFPPDYVYAPADPAPPGEVVLVRGGYVLTHTGTAAATPMAAELALLLTTSGTTGSRALVRLSHGNLDANAAAIVQSLAITADDRAITTMPMSYTYGLSIIHSHLLAGASVVLTEAPLTTAPFWRAMKDHAVTTFGGVPFIYEMLKRLRFERMDLPALRLITQAGGRLGPDLTTDFAQICARKGIDFVVMYGQTEATARIACLPAAQAVAKAGRIGMAIPGGHLSLVDDGGAEISAANVAGELIYRGENVSLGYARSAADLARGDDNGGVLHTGDIATRDEDGFYAIVGRKKRFLKVFGHRVNLDEVEQIVRAAGWDCACGGDDDKLRVFVPAGVDAQQVHAMLTAQTALNPHGFAVIAVDVIPRSESGKVDYAALGALPS